MSEKTQTRSTSTTLLSQMLGASLLSCSFIIAKLGWVLSIIAFTFTVVYDLFMYKYFVDISHYTQAQSYREITEKVVSKSLSLLLEISIIISYFGFVTAYIIISSSSVVTFIRNIFHYEANTYVVKAILAFLIIFPLCLLKSLKQLAKIATISGVAIFIFAFSIIVYFFLHVGSGTLCAKDAYTNINFGLRAFPDVSPFMAFLYFIMYIPALQGNFTAHTVIPTLIRELQGPPVLRKKVVYVSINVATLLALFLYVAVGFMGAGMFGGDIKDNLLTAFAPCKWIWVDILSIIYAFVVIIAYPLVIYPIKISIVGMCKKDPLTKQGYRIQVLVALVFVVLSTALAMVLESIVAIFGLFSSLTGVIFYFVVPICLIVQYPKVKKENIHMDHLQAGEVTVDPVLVGVLSMVSPTISDATIQRVRTLSNKMFGPAVEAPVDANQPQRTLSYLRPRALSISVSEGGVEKIRTSSITKRRESSSALHDDPHPETIQTATTKEMLTGFQAEEKSDITVEENVVSEESGYISKARKTTGIVAICFFSLICAVGVVMNSGDVAKALKKK
ncbi:Amino_acid transporter family protein [Hexamita inflata]|uniref:Amino acid transporter family protein n=1 Tax=Hexamita inflata TaxID=28002 RepID=A0AA86NPP4_9EUKA|nr:Amino acid transporter family protein [Hexamita inflata]